MQGCSIKSFFTTFLLVIVIALQIAAPLSAYAIGIGSVPVSGSITVSPVEPPVRTGTNKFEALWDTITSTDWILKNIGEPAVRIVIRAAIVSITQQVVDWISADGGTNVGFVANFEQTLTNELDDRAGEFLQQLDYIDFCGNIGAYLKLNLRVSAGGLKQRAKCSLSAIVSNVQNFYDNFQNGGWEAFLKTNVDIQNNTAGAFLIALDAKIGLESQKKEGFVYRYQQSLLGGVLGTTKSQKCVQRPDVCIVDHGVTDCTPQEPLCTTETVVNTPGSVIEAALNKVTGSGMDLGVSAKFIDEAVVAPIVSALLNRMITSAHGIFGKSPNTTVSYSDPLFTNVKEIGSSRDTLRSSINAALFSAYGGLKAANDQFLALRKELIANPAPGASAEQEIKTKTIDLLVKKQTLTAQEDRLMNTILISFTTVTPSDISSLDAKVTQILNLIDPITTELGSSPYTSPVGTMKTDTLNTLSGSRTHLAGEIALINQTIKEIDKALAYFGAATTTHATQIDALNQDRKLLTNPGSTTGGLLQELQSADLALQDEYNAMQNLVTTSEIVAETGVAIKVIQTATTAELNANTAMGSTLSYLDSITGSSAATTTSTTPTPAPPPEPPPIPPPIESGGE